MFENVNFDLKSADENKSLKNFTVCKEFITCRLIEFIYGAVFVTHKRMPNSNKHTQFCTESRIKTNKLANRKKKMKKVLKSYWTRTHTFEC